jgi:photosystem II stability/assembly factor-like uncharacterized protein
MHFLSRSLAIFLLIPVISSAQWTKLNSGTDASLRGVSAVDEKVCWASGSKGTVLRTTDGGAHWMVLHPDLDRDGAKESLAALDFRDIEAFDANTAIAMSAGLAEKGAARIIKTKDGGLHWEQGFVTHTEGVFLD